MARREEEMQQQQEQQSSGLGNIVKAGALVAAGALGFNYRRQLGKGLRSAGDFVGTGANSLLSRAARSDSLREGFQDASAFAKAMAHATDSRSVLSHIRNPGRFEDRFQQSIQNSLEVQARSRRHTLGGGKLDVLEEMQKMRSDRKRLRNEVFDAHRFNGVIEELTEKLPEQMKNGLDSMLASHKQQSNLFAAPTKDKVTAFSKAMQENTELAHSLKLDSDSVRKKFEDTLFETLDRYKDRKSDGFALNPQKRKELVTVEREMRNAMHDGLLESRKRKNGPVEKFMSQGGWRRTTLEDLAEHKTGNLLAGYDRRRPMKNSLNGKDSGHVDARMGSKASKLMEVDPRYRDIVADDHLWINAKGEFMDTRWMAEAGYKGMDGFRQSVQVPFLRFNPLDLMHFTTWQGKREAPKTAFKRIGTIDPGLHGSVEEFKHPLAHNQDAAVGILARNYMNTSDGKVFDLTTGDLVKEGVYQASARFGMMPRAMASMANLHRVDYTPRKGVKGKLMDIFDLGRQETDSVQKRIASTLTKFDEYEWGPNIRQGMYKWQEEAFMGVPVAERTGLSPESGFKLVNSQLSSKSQPLSYDTAQYLNERVKKSYGEIDVDLSKLNTEEEIMNTLGRMHQALSTPNSRIARTQNDLENRDVGIEKQLISTWESYARDEVAFKQGKRILPNNAPYMPEFLNALDMHEVDLVERVDDVRRLIHQHAMKQVTFASTGEGNRTVGSIVQQGIREGNLPKASLQEVRNLEIGLTMRKWWDDVYESPERRESALNEFAGRVLDENDSLSRGIQDAMEDLNPKWAMGPGEEPPQYFGFTDSISMNQGRGYKYALEQYNKRTKEKGIRPTEALVSSAMDVLKQPFAGRSNTGDVTTATLPFYYLAERLDNAVAQAGIGLSQKNRGSMQSVLFNQMGRRIVMPYMAYQQAVWLDGMTGDFASDKAAETYANMHEDVGWIKELTGLNDIGRQWSRVFNGADQLAESPLGRAANFATFGLFDHKSGEEIREFYESGEVAVRKGRYWGIGSNTPFTGGKVDRYVPNWYRRIKSDYQFTENAKGSEKEYWANHWMPTLTNPLAPVKHFLTDPYHYENKHKESRPYPVSGGFSELEVIPLIGPALNNTVGRVLKPRREHPDLEKAHRAYIEEINANIEAQYQMADEGGLLQGMPAGGFSVTQGAIGAPGGGDGTAIGGVSGVTPEQYAMMIGEGGEGAGGRSRAELSAINSMYSEIGGPALGATGKNVRSVTALEDLRDPDVLADLSDIGTMYSGGSTLRDSFYSLSEMAGIYGFSTKSLMGFEESGRGMTLEQSTRMSSYARAFWDMELGGFGGQLSEIGRRYNPRDPNKNFWNPIKNTMPSWLPGPEYFTDFQHGDPYVKVANGEMRLPGESYESLYELHPDALGEYGTFDRFRILADVAPYSENYKFYRKMVSRLNQSGMLDEDTKAEYAEIRDQVSERKKKHRFYNRRFDNADVNEETVTITKMIDATTFLTREYGKTPIKMAGVKIKADDTENQQWLEQFLKPGEQVRVALDADPLFRVRDDTFETMRAVVYANKNEEGLPFYNSNRGQNLNFMLANRKSGGLFGLGGERKASVHDDGSATATRALFSDDMVTVGKMWETLTHDFLPSLPIIGTIADKFLQVRSPLEMYKRNEVYGKAWRSWEEPLKGWMQPMVETIASKHPLLAAAQGAGIGWLFAKKTPTGTAKYMGTRIGAIIGGGAATIRVFSERLNAVAGDGESWLPDRRKKEREINEYYDRLKYIKYRGLYTQAAEEAKRREGVDIEALIQEHEERGGENKGRRNTLTTMKKQLSLSKKLGYGDQEAVQSQLDTIRDDLKEIEGDRPVQELGKYSMLALRYKEEYESTLYGADVHGDMTKIFRALPAKDREFFTEFMKAAPKERQEILKLVPKDQRRFYQAKWGLEVDKQESLQSYFKDKHLPDENWDGWRPDKSLENYKIKAVKNEALEMTEFNYWGDDEKRAEAANVKALPMRSLSSTLDVTRLEKALRGAGLQDVSVSMTTSQREGDNQIDLAVDYMKDRSREIVSELNNNMGGVFG